MDQSAVRITLSAASNAPSYSGGPFALGVAMLNTRRTVAGWANEWIISIGAFGESVDLSLGGNYAQLSSSSLTIAAGTWWAGLRAAGGAVEGALVEIGTLTTGGAFTTMWTGYARAVSCDGLALTVECESVLSQRHKSIPTSVDIGAGLVSAPLVYGNSVESVIKSNGGKTYYDFTALRTTHKYDRVTYTTHFSTVYPNEWTTIDQAAAKYRETEVGDAVYVDVAVTAGIAEIQSQSLAIECPYAVTTSFPLPVLEDPPTNKAIGNTGFVWDDEISTGNVYLEITSGSNVAYCNVVSYIDSVDGSVIQTAPTPDGTEVYGPFFQVSQAVRRYNVFPNTLNFSGVCKVFKADSIVYSDSETYSINKNGVQIPFIKIADGVFTRWSKNIDTMWFNLVGWMPVKCLSATTSVWDDYNDTTFTLHDPTTYDGFETEPTAVGSYDITGTLKGVGKFVAWIDCEYLGGETQPGTNPYTADIGIVLEFCGRNGTVTYRELTNSAGMHRVSSPRWNNYPQNDFYPSGTSGTAIYLTTDNMSGVLDASEITHIRVLAYGSRKRNVRIYQITLGAVYGPIWDEIATDSTSIDNGRTITTAWPSPAATGDTLGDVIDSQRNIMLDLYYSQLGLTNAQVDTASFAAVPYRSASLVLATAQSSDATIAQLCADADLVGYHTRDGKEAAREMYKYVGTTTYAWTAEVLLDSGSVVPQPTNKFAPAPIVNACTDWVTDKPKIVAAINDPATDPNSVTPSNYLQYAPGYTNYAVAAEAQLTANSGYKRHGLKDATTVNAPTWGYGEATLDNYWVGSTTAVSRLEWITARKDVYQCEIDADAFPLTAAVGDHVRITDPYMGDFIGLLCEWAFDAMAETVKIVIICDPQLAQRNIINVLVSDANQINVLINDANQINVLI